MIGWLRGKIVDKEHPGKLILNVQGVGYEVETSLTTFFQIELAVDEIALYIHTVVREDALQLYGFHNKEERSLFRALIKVNGVGPKMAITILSSIKPNDFIQCIQEKNAVLLTKVPGIGNKTAQRLIIEMKDSLQQFSSSASQIEVFYNDKLEQSEAIKALESLGYKTQEAFKAIKKIDDGTKSCEQLIRQALQVLSN